MTAEEGPGGYVRVLVTLDHDHAAGAPHEEWLWAEPLGSDRYRVESSPFFAYGISHGDVVVAPEGGEMPRVSAIERKCGHRTLRLALDDRWTLEQREIRLFLDDLLGLGCTFEAMPPKIVALDVPPEVDVVAAVERLQMQVNDGVLVWEWADPRPS